MSYIVPSGLSYAPTQEPISVLRSPTLAPPTPVQVIQPNYALVSRPASMVPEIIPTQELVQTEYALRPVVKTAVTKLGSRYSKVINIYSDLGYPDNNVAIEDLLIPDKLYLFFRSILQENDSQIDLELKNAVQFYSDRFGIDLSKFKPIDGYWTFGEHRFYPYQKNGNYHAIEIEGQCCSPVNKTAVEGGFVLVVGAPGFVAKGTYGKETGENVPPGSLIFFGYYVLVDENSNGSVYHFRSNSPSRTSVEVPLTWNLDVYDYRTSLWGKSIGSSVIEKKALGINRVNGGLVSTQGFVPTVTTMNSPIGTRRIDTSTVIRNNENLPLIVNNVPVAASSRLETIVAPVNVPTYAPIIRQEIVEYQETANSKVVLISRNIITF